MDFTKKYTILTGKKEPIHSPNERSQYIKSNNRYLSYILDGSPNSYKLPSTTNTSTRKHSPLNLFILPINLLVNSSSKLPTSLSDKKPFRLKTSTKLSKFPSTNLTPRQSTKEFPARQILHIKRVKSPQVLETIDFGSISIGDRKPYRISPLRKLKKFKVEKKGFRPQRKNLLYFDHTVPEAIAIQTKFPYSYN